MLPSMNGPPADPGTEAPEAVSSTVRRSVHRSVRSVRGDTAAAVVLGVAVAVWILVFSVLVVLRQDRFGSYDFDMGIHDQSIWLLAHGRSFMTVRGLHVLGHHATPGYLLFAPLSWLGGGPDSWNTIQVASLGLAAVPVFLLARHRTGQAWIGTALGVALLLHPALGFFSWELFHPEVVAIAPLLAAYYCSVRRQWVWFALWAVVAVSWKEDVALFVVMLGLLMVLRGDRKAGLWTLGAALAWFSAWTFALFPWINHGDVQSALLYTEVGRTPTGILHMALTHPDRIARPLTGFEARDFLRHLLGPFAFTPLLAPAVLLLGLPQYVLNLLTNVPWTKVITYHYAALPLAAATLAMVEGIAWLRDRIRAPRIRVGVVTVVVVAVLASALYTQVIWGISPISNQYRTGWWPLVDSPRNDTARRDLALIPADATVSATYNLVPHLSRRPEIYTFANPWRLKNYGIEGEQGRNPGRVDWLFLDRQTLGPDERALLDALIHDGRFRIVSDRDDFVVARRVRRGSGR